MNGEVLLEAVVVVICLMADVAPAPQCVLSLLVVFEAGSSGEDSTTFDMVTDELMILGSKLLRSFALSCLMNFNSRQVCLSHARIG